MNTVCLNVTVLSVALYTASLDRPDLEGRNNLTQTLHKDPLVFCMNLIGFECCVQDC